MPANYDSTAWFYDRLSRLVYGDALLNAQRYLLHRVPAGSAILIIGGGTGQTLEDLSARHPSGLNITYVELSAKMIALSRKRDAANNTVTFINQPIETAGLPHSFDVIITAFLFDNYSDEELKHTFPLIDNLLTPGGLWLNTDFQLTGKWWQWVLLKGMYSFFKLFSRIATSNSPNVKKYFIDAGYELVEKGLFYGDFVITQAWQKGSFNTASLQGTKQSL